MNAFPAKTIAVLASHNSLIYASAVTKTINIIVIKKNAIQQIINLYNMLVKSKVNVFKAIIILLLFVMNAVKTVVNVKIINSVYNVLKVMLSGKMEDVFSAYIH